MRITNLRKNPVNDTGFLALIERFWIVILGLILATPILLRYLKDSQVKHEVNDTQEQIKLNTSQNLNPLKQQTELNKITSNQYLQTVARNVAANLGTLYQSRGGMFAWLNPRGWTENDTLVYNDLKNLNNPGQVRLVIELYFFLTGKNLREDVSTLLDTELLAKLKFFK